MLQYDMLLLRFGEIAIKGKNRSRFENAALSHVRALLHSFPKVKVVKDYGRIYVELNGEPCDLVTDTLKKVFGVTSISPVKVVNSDLEHILVAATSFIKHLSLEKNTSFKISARRVWKQFPHSSHEMNRLVSTPILSACPHLKVDVHHPEIDLRLEIREKSTYLYCEVIQAAGGFPRGTNGKAMLLLSGGIDSPVAGWSAMRRGLEIDCVHFQSYPFTSKKAEEKVIDLAKVLSRYSGKIRLHLVPFTDIQTALASAGHEELIITVMRRAMLRIATKLAEKHDALALVTGDSLGQVASQTLSSMNVIGKVTDIPLLRPLVMSDKDEIIRLAKEIGTYDLSILPYEDCCTLFVPKSPSTNPNLRIVEKIESTIANFEEMIAVAVEGTETILIRPDAEVQRESEDDTVIEDKWF